MGTHGLPRFRNLIMVARPYCCLSGIIRELVRDYNKLGCASRAHRVRLIKTAESRVTIVKIHPDTIKSRLS
jgi:hypothetical protein